MGETNPGNIPVVIFAGGRGSRFNAETQVLPKPLIEVAGKPILQHIIDLLHAQGFREFIVATGYMGEAVNDYFSSRGPLFSYDRREGHCQFYDRELSAAGNTPCFIRCFNTGLDSHVGRRLAVLNEMPINAIANRRFVMTYGDGLCDVDMRTLIDGHEVAGAGVTMTAVHPPGRFGVVQFCDDTSPEVYSFSEKPTHDWINGGFMVAEPEFIEQYIEGDSELERTALNELAASGGLHAHRHHGFWMCMDSRRDLEAIEAVVAAEGGLLPWRRDMMSPNTKP